MTSKKPAPAAPRTSARVGDDSDDGARADADADTGSDDQIAGGDLDEHLLDGHVEGHLLIVAAWAPELRALGRFFTHGAGKSGKAPRPAAPLPPSSSPRVRVEGAAPVRAVVGVGLCDAAAGAARLIERQRPRAVILIGTAGLYPGAGPIAIGTAAIARNFMVASSAVARSTAYFPEPMAARTAATGNLVDELSAATGLPVVDVACPLGITRATAVAQQLRKSTGASLENLEAFAVARAAATANVPFAAVLGVANDVGPEGHTQWRAHNSAAAAAACAAIRTWLGRT